MPLEFLLALLHKEGHWNTVDEGEYFFTDVVDIKTFDLYRKYGICFSHCPLGLLPADHVAHIQTLLSGSGGE